MNKPPLHSRLILPRETGWIEEATEINNRVWGSHLATPREGYTSRASQGFLFGAFGAEGLEGTVSAAELPMEELEQADQSISPLSTWVQATQGGTCANAQPGSDALCCFACTNRLAHAPVHRPLDPAWADLPGEHGEWARLLATLEDVDSLPPALSDAAHSLLPAYIEANLDPVLRFHGRNKGPLGGATAWKLLRGGRPADLEALGYNVLLRYPEITRESCALLVSGSRYLPGSTGETLILAAARLACSLPAVRWMVAYSRPIAYRRHLTNLFARLAGAQITTRRLEEQAFLDKATALL